MSDDWKNDRAEGSIHEYEAKKMAESAAKYKLQLENDKTNIAFYNKNFPDLTPEKRENLRVLWIAQQAKINGESEE